jgi:hypothetical protein
MNLNNSKNAIFHFVYHDYKLTILATCMSSKASMNQVRQYGYSFISIGSVFVIISLIPLSIASNSDNLFIWGFCLMIGMTVLVIGELGLMQKLFTDGVTLGLKNGKLGSNSGEITPMSFEETFYAGFDLLRAIMIITLISSVAFALSFDAQKATDSMIFLIIGILIFVGGLLGIHVKIIGDSISHAISASGYSTILQDLAVQNDVLEKKLGGSGIGSLTGMERELAISQEVSATEWIDSKGYRWKKLGENLYWWNVSGWEKYGREEINDGTEKTADNDSKKKKKLVLKSKFKKQNNKQTNKDSKLNLGWTTESVLKSKKKNNMEKSKMIVDLTEHFDKFCNKVRDKTSHDEKRLKKLEELIQIYRWSQPTNIDGKTDGFYTIVQIIDDIFAIAPDNFSSTFMKSEYFVKYQQIFSDPMKLNQVQRKAYFVLINQILKLDNWD